MLEIKQTCFRVSAKAKECKIFEDSARNQYVYLNCSQQFVSNHKKFLNTFEGIKLYGQLEKLNELISRLDKNIAVKIEVYDCELYLMQYQDKNVKPYASCHDWNFDSNKFKPPVLVAKSIMQKRQKATEKITEQAVAECEIDEPEEQKLLFDGDIELPY